MSTPNADYVSTYGVRRRPERADWHYGDTGDPERVERVAAEGLDRQIQSAPDQVGAGHDAFRRFVRGRAEAMDMSDKIRDNWNADGSLRDEAGAATDG